MSPKILLIADVGTNADGFYHVGDEAMLFQTVQWYRQHFPQIKLGMLSRSRTHEHWSVTEQLHLPFPYAAVWLASPGYCFHLIIRVAIHQRVGLPVLRKREVTFIDFVRRFDVLHFTGGGNIYSHHAPWLYYVFFLLCLGKLLGRKIWLTSQTIGPFNWFDKILAKCFLRLSDVLVLRGQSQALQWKTAVGLDAAYDLPLLRKSVLPTKPTKTLRIGLSVHEWQNFGTQVTQVVVSALTQLAKTQKIELVLLPHVFTKDATTWDPGFMSKISQQLPAEIKVTTVEAHEILSAVEPSVLVKTGTAELDLLIATRYHGLVFALSSDVPVVTFKMDDYYAEKNMQLLALVYENNWQRLVLDIQGADVVKELQATITTLSKNLAAEKVLLRNNNQRLQKDTELFQLAPLVEKLPS